MSNISHNCMRISVEGAGGTGKTRFLAEIQRNAASLGLRVVRGITPADPHGIIVERSDLPLGAAPSPVPPPDAPPPRATPRRGSRSRRGR